MGRWKRFEERESLSISAPTNAEQFVRNFKHSVIVICKHGFTAENKCELSIHKGDVLKVLDRPGNGWLLVQFIDTVNKYGLIPAKYVDIAVNDPLNPITLQWLHEIDEIMPANRGLHIQANNIDTSIARRLSTHNKVYPISVSIFNVLLLEDRYWYRLDITYSDDSKAYIRRYYEDFYNLHGLLLDLIDNETNANGTAPSLLPKLPEPIPSTTSSQSNNLIEKLLNRCNELSVYINRLFADNRFHKSEVLRKWLDISYRNLGGLILRLNSNLPRDEISKRILPNSIDILNDKTITHYNGHATLNKPAKPMPPCVFSNQPDPSSTTQWLNNTPYNSIANPPPKLAIDTSNHSYNNSFGSHSETSIFSDIDSPKSPDTPFSLSHDMFTLKSNYIKLKIIKKDEDIIALKISRNDISTVADLKRLVSAKLPYKNLYIKVRDFKCIDSPNYNFSQVLNETEKIILRVT